MKNIVTKSKPNKSTGTCGRDPTVVMNDAPSSVVWIQ
jgi:hypothetical protein